MIEGSVPAKARRCGCCGSPDASIVVEETFAAYPVYRCERHVGRNPCCIPGCGRTFAHNTENADGRGAEDYSWIIICGRHWRLVPRYMRDIVSRVRRDARRQGWTQRNRRRHGRLWERCRRAILEGQRLDADEIERMFGFGVAV